MCFQILRRSSSLEKPVIIFDLYGTLVDWRYAITSFIRLYAPETAIGKFFECDIREVVKYRPYKEILTNCLSEILAEHNIYPSSELIDSFIKTFAKSPLYPDTIYALKILKKRGFKTTILSNTDRDLVEITLHGWRDLVDYVVVAEDTKFYKPNLEAFQKTYEIIKIEPRDAVHVSAYPQYDLIPASELGASTIMVDRGLGYSWHVSIKNLLELLDVI